MSGITVGVLVGLAFGIMLVRRRSVAIALIGIQSALVGVAAIGLTSGRRTEFLIASLVLLIRATAVPALLALTRRRTPEPRLVRAPSPPLVRLLIGIVVTLVAVAALPPLGLGDRVAEHGAVALLTLGVAIVVVRRPTLFQLLGLVVAENGVYLLAVAVPGGVPSVIELGVLFDLVLVVTVGAAFTYKIHGELGTGDTELLRGLRD